MFYDLAEEVFILKISIWRPESENRPKRQIVLILVTAFLYKFNEALRKGGNPDPLCSVEWKVSRERAPKSLNP